MMELMTILVIHLMLAAGWIQCSDATDCTLHVSSQSSMVSLQCSNSLCQLELQIPQGGGENCYSNTPNCYLDDCNRVYNICDISQNQSSSRCRELSNGGQGVHNSGPPINCTVTLVPAPVMEIHLRCPKGECTHTTIGNNTTCSRELGIACEESTGCSKPYTIYTTTEPLTTTEAQLTTNESITSEMTCTCPNPTASSEISTIAINHTSCNNTVSIQSCPNTVTLYSSTSVYISTTLYSTVGSTSTTDPISNTTGTTSTETYTSLPSTCPERPILLKIVVPAAGGTIGLLIVLLLVVTTGWVCTCRIMKKRGKMEINIMQDSFPNRLSTADDRQTFTRTQQRLDDNPLCKEHATPPQAHPNPPQQQRYDDNPLCKQHAAPPQAHSNPPQQLRPEHLYSISLATKRKEPTHENIQNGLNWACSGGGVSMGGANQIPRKRENNEHEYDHLVKVVKQTEGGQSKRNERISFERNQKYHISDKQERATTLQYQTQEYLTPIKQEPKRFQNRPNMGLFQDKLTNIIQDGGASVGVGVASQFPRQRGEIEHQYDHLVKKVKKKDSQRKRDEGIDEGEMDHDYHELEGPGDDYDYPEEKERDIVYHVLDGPTPIETDLKTFQNRPNKVYPGGGVSMGGATQFPQKQKPCDHQYDHLVKAAKKKGGQSKKDELADAERDHGYHVLEGPPGVDVDDYDYPVEREGPEIVYHVLDGPTPVEEETQFIY